MSRNDKCLSQEEITKLLEIKKKKATKERHATIEEVNFIYKKFQENISESTALEFTKMIEDIDESSIMMTETNGLYAITFKFKLNLDTGFMIISPEGDTP